jgi:Family of unknown function (DUF6010)
MTSYTIPYFGLSDSVPPIVIAFVYISFSSTIKEPARQKYNAIVVAGAGAAYLSGGLGLWEFAFCALFTVVAYKGLSNYSFIGLGWLLHSFWDVMHHLYGNPIVPFSANSSAGCAVCDAVLAIWFFAGAPSLFNFNPARSKNTTA